MTTTPSPKTIALTGAAGMMASLLRPYLARAGHTVRLIDLVAAPDPGPLESVHEGSVTDARFMSSSLAGVTAVIHLGGIHREKTWEEIADTNITGTQVTLEAARINDVTRVLLASSTHAVGFHPNSAAGRDTAPAPRPDTYYGVSKAAMEALGSLYADRFAMKVISARIGTGEERPRSARARASWLSPADSFRLVEATLNDLGAPGHHIIWAVSANTSGWANLSAGHQIGFHPQDNAEDFACDIHTEADHDPFASLLGGEWTNGSHRIGVDNYPERERLSGNS